MRTDNIKREVARLKAKYQTNDPYEMCEAVGIRVFEQPMGTAEGSCKGFLMSNARCRMAVINSDLPAEVQRIILAHELGHGILHGNRSIKSFHDVTMYDDADPMEYEANIFAAEYLICDDSFFAALEQQPSFYQAASILLVPPELLDFKVRLLQKEGYSLFAPRIAQSDFLKRDITKPMN